MCIYVSSWIETSDKQLSGTESEQWTHNNIPPGFCQTGSWETPARQLAAASYKLSMGVRASHTS